MAAVAAPSKAQSPTTAGAADSAAVADQVAQPQLQPAAAKDALVAVPSHKGQRKGAAAQAAQPRKHNKRGGLLCCFAPPGVADADEEGAAAQQQPIINIQAVGRAAAKQSLASPGKVAVPAITATDSGAPSSEEELFEEFFDARSQASSFDLGGGVAAYQAEVVVSDFVQEANEPDQSTKHKQQQLAAAAAAGAGGAAGAATAAAAQQRDARQQQQQEQRVEEDGNDAQPHWVPNPPLMFTEGKELEFVPVPAVTGFAGNWELIKERTSPHPQPIDVMIGANAIVRRIHASLPGIIMEEDDGLFKVIGQPGFIPKGIPSVHTETYDKTHETKISWWPRRDVQLGKAVGEVFFTADGTLILRSHTFPILGRKPDFVVEDYLSLEEGGSVLVDRMCCHCTRTGRSAQQMQVVRKIGAAGPGGGQA